MMSTDDMENYTTIDSGGNNFGEGKFGLVLRLGVGVGGYEDDLSLLPKLIGSGSEGRGPMIK